MIQRLYIGDLHLQAQDPRLECVIELLKQWPADWELVILGDLFDTFLGKQQLRDPDWAPLFEALQQAAQRSKIIFVPGNRDFLFDQKITESLGIHYADDAITLNDSVYVCHGDLFLSDDLGYQRYRRFVRSTFFRTFFPLMPYTLCKKAGQWFRRQSRQAKAKKTEQHYQLDSDLLCQAGAPCQQVVIGHIHKEQKISKNNTTIYVVADWSQGPAGLIQKGDHFEFVHWQADEPMTVFN